MASNGRPNGIPNHAGLAFRRKSTPGFIVQDSLDHGYMLDEYDTKLTTALTPSGSVQLEQLPLIQSTTNEDAREDLFIQKLRQCEIPCDFSSIMCDVQNKDIKRRTLIEIKTAMGMAEMITPKILQSFFRMVSQNLFRDWAPPVNPKAPEYDSEEDPPVQTKEWPHFEMIYEAFTLFLERSYGKLPWAKENIDRRMVNQILSLFNTQDSRERDFAKKTLHRLYSKCVPHRAYIRATMSGLLSSYMYDKHSNKSFGVAELLEISGSIIHGFSLPIKQEHIRFLTKVLVPLHSPSTLSQYHQQLAYCVLQFIEKDSNLIHPVLHGLIRYWPKCNSTKEVMFLNEFEELVDVMEDKDFDTLTPAIFGRVAACCKSTHFQVAERSLYFFNNMKVLQQVEKKASDILPVILPILCFQQENHWSQNVQTLAGNVLRLLQDTSVSQMVKDHISQSRKRKRMEDVDAERTLKWARIVQMANNEG